MVELFNGFVLSTADIPHRVKQLLRLQVIADHFAILADVDHVKWVQAVLVVDVDAPRSVF